MNSTSIDLIIRIKNGYMSKKNSISGVYSRLNEAILTILKQEGYIDSFMVAEENNKKTFVINLLYRDSWPTLTGVNLFSTPGKREYRRLSQIRSVLGGAGLAFYSTPKGVLTDVQARDKKTGGEILFEIW